MGIQCLLAGGSIAKSCPTLGTPWTVATRPLCPWDSPGKNTGVGCRFLLQGIFPTQGLNPGPLDYKQSPHYRCILYWLSHGGSPMQCLKALNFVTEASEWWTWRRALLFSAVEFGITCYFSLSLSCYICQMEAKFLPLKMFWEWKEMQ